MKITGDYKGFEAVQNEAIRDAIDVGLYTGMRSEKWRMDFAFSRI